MVIFSVALRLRPFVNCVLFESGVGVRSVFILGMLLGFDCFLLRLVLHNAFVNVMCILYIWFYCSDMVQFAANIDAWKPCAQG